MDEVFQHLKIISDPTRDDGRKVRVFLNSHDITQSVRSVTFNINHGGLPTATIELLSIWEIDGFAIVQEVEHGSG